MSAVTRSPVTVRVDPPDTNALPPDTSSKDLTDQSPPLTFKVPADLPESPRVILVESTEPLPSRFNSPPPLTVRAFEPETVKREPTPTLPPAIVKSLPFPAVKEPTLRSTLPAAIFSPVKVACALAALML